MFLSILFVIDSSLLVTVILLQKKHSKGISSLGVGSTSGNFMDRNKGRTKEGKLELYTKYLGIGYFLIALTMSFTF